jgi:hypothetical protein
MSAAETQKAIKALEQDYERQKEAFERWKGSSIFTKNNCQNFNLKLSMPVWRNTIRTQNMWNNSKHGKKRSSKS